MKEACNCGRTGEVEDREPVYLGDGEHALRCPDCGHLEDLHCPPATPERPYSKSLHAGGIGRYAGLRRSGQCRPHGLRSSRQTAGKTFTG
jgi:hypothetical protein